MTHKWRTNLKPNANWEVYAPICLIYDSHPRANLPGLANLGLKKFTFRGPRFTNDRFLAKKLFYRKRNYDVFNIKFGDYFPGLKRVMVKVLSISLTAYWAHKKQQKLQKKKSLSTAWQEDNKVLLSG